MNHATSSLAGRTAAIGSPEVKTPTLMHEINLLGQNVSALHGEISSIEDQLLPVRTITPRKDEESEAAPSPVNLSLQLRELNLRVIAAIERIRVMRGELDV